MLDCATRVPDQQAVGGGYYPRYVYSQPAEFGETTYQVKHQLKEFLPASHSPLSQYPPSPEVLPQQTPPLSAANPPYSSNPGQNYYANCIARNYPQGLSTGGIFNSSAANINSAAKLNFSQGSGSQYTPQPISRENSLHQSPTGSGGSASYSPSPVDTKPYQTALYWPTTTSHYDYDYISKSADYVLQQMHHQQGKSCAPCLIVYFSLCIYSF